MITLRGTRVQVLIYNEERKLQQLIFSPSISAVSAEILLDDYDIEGIKGVISSYIILSALHEIQEPIEVVLPPSMKKQTLILKASYIDDTLWEDYLVDLKKKAKEKEKEVERKEYFKKSMKRVRSNKKPNKKVKVMYFMDIIRKDTKETYKICTQPTHKAIANQIGIPIRQVKLYLGKDYKLIISSKRKNMQQEIEKHGLMARLQING
jgi:hypothetical protein